MAKFKKKPIIIEAMPIKEPTNISTLEGMMHGNPGDWLIRGVKDELYPCEKSIFFQSYEPADEEARQLWKQHYGEEQTI